DLTEEETDDSATEETEDTATDDAADDEEEEDAEEDTDTEDDSSADDESADGEGSDGEITYSGEYGDFTVASFEQYTLEPEEAEEEEDDEEEEEEEEEEEAEPTELVLIEYEFTNNSDVPTTPEEAFGLDLAVRQMAETGESTLETLTMDLPE